MRIVHISTYSSVGGASKAAYRIHLKLLEKGIESDMLVLKKSNEPLVRVTEVKNDFFYRLKDYFFLRFDKFLFRKHLRKDSLPFSFNFFPRVSIQNHPLVRQADLVSLYWVGANFLTPHQLAAIKKPLVWRFSDKWAFTGNCHLTGGCVKYEATCGNCPQLTLNKKRDFTFHALRRKLHAWKNRDLTIVAPSSWMENAVKASTVFKSKNITRIATGIDHTIFFPDNKVQARQQLGLDAEKRIVLFGANNPFKTNYKGGKFFLDIIYKLPVDKYSFIVFGSDKNNTNENIPGNVVFLGEFKDENELRLVYNAADFFISPSIEDNLPNTVLEAMACGTPCVAFQNSGGVVDVIDHQQNGYLAELMNSDDLVNGVLWIESNNLDGAISRLALEKIRAGFTLEDQANSFIELYKTILKRENVS